MARYKQGMLESAIRDIVSDVIIERLGGGGRERNRDSAILESDDMNDETPNFRVGATRRRRRRSSTIKGRVTNPATDKRLKANRNKDEE